MSRLRITSQKKEIRWALPSVDEQAAERLAQRHQLHPAIARILAVRGFVDDPALEVFLDPGLRHLRSPQELAGMDLAVERTLAAIQRGEKICVYGDYDVDGVTSTALMVEVLRFLGADPHIIIPNRFTDGYGMNLRRIAEIASLGCTLLITVDNGITALAEIAEAKARGIDVIVTDHHRASETMPEAFAIVNPNRPDAVYTHGRLCGVGVAFKVSHALLRASGKPEADCRDFLRNQLDLVALGTIQDVAPLLGENRVLTKAGLTAIANTRRPGLRALIEKSRYKKQGAIDATAVAFGLGPRINAAGRTADARIALDLLLCHDTAMGESLAGKLDDLNRERQEIERSILDASLIEAEQRLTRFHEHLLVVGGEHWHTGVIGIVASRLTERFDVPAIVLCIDNGYAKGSARSVDGFDIHDALVACAQHLETYGGHAGAAGLKLKTSNLSAFRSSINDYSGGFLSSREGVLTVPVDAELQPEEISFDLINALDRLQPFGEGNPEPLFMLRGVRSTQPPRAVGKDTVKLRLGAGRKQFSAVGFGMAERLDEFTAESFDVLCKPSINEYYGEAELQLQVVDVRAGAGS